jgi:hypothetical protein
MILRWAPDENCGKIQAVSPLCKHLADESTMPPKHPVPASPDPLARLPRAAGLPAGFHGLPPTARLKALLDLPDPGAVLRPLRPDEYYQVLNGIGLEDAAELLPYGTREQRKAVADIDAWAGGTFLPERLDRCLEAALTVSSDFAIRWLSDLDPEVIALRLARAVTEVFTSDEMENAQLPDAGVLASPDRAFTLVCADAEETEQVRHWLDLLWARDLEEAHRLLHALRRETTAALEEDAFRFRDSRMQDLGFPPANDRFGLWEPFDVRGLRARLAAEEPGAMPRPGGPPPLALPLQGADRGLFAWHALAALADSPALAPWVSDLMLLVNRVLGGRTDEWFDPQSWSDAASHTLRWVSVGLEDLAEGDPSKAGPLALAASPVELFRAGVEAARPAHLRARRVVGLVGGTSGLRRLDESAAAAVHALAAFPPAVSDPRPPHAPRDPEGLADLARASAEVAAAEAVTRFARDALGFDAARAAPGTGPTFATVMATAWARGVLTGAPSLEPLSGEDLQALRIAAFEGSRLRPVLRRPADLAAAVSNEDRAVRQVLGRALDRVEEALGGLDPAGAVDPRFVGDCLIVKA